MDVSRFDLRRYPTLSVVEGYGEWSESYETAVQEEMDLRLLSRLQAVEWEKCERVVDLACGTGRVGEWIKNHGIGRIDGVDLTPEMLALAEAKNIYRKLVLGDVCATGLVGETYDLCMMVLADEHLADLNPLYQEAFRITRPDGFFVVVGYHPFFLMEGIITHYHRTSGDPVAIESHIHLLSDHAKAAHRVGWTLREMDEGIIDDAWLLKKPKWKKFLGRPVSFAFVWQKICVIEQSSKGGEREPSSV